MTPSAYQKAAIRTEAPASVVLDRLNASPQQGELLIRLTHASLGMLTEAGEFGNVVKKALFYGKPIDRVNAAEELGDQLWYIAIACQALELDLAEIMLRNIQKLVARFPDSFNERQADPDNRNLANEAYATAYGNDARTPAEVVEARKTVRGCCNKHTQAESCDCYENAVERSRAKKA